MVTRMRSYFETRQSLRKVGHAWERLVARLWMHSTENPRSLTDAQQNEIRLFMVVRNEELRLPYTLKYYLGLGVDRIIVLENYSEDRSYEILKKTERVHVFRTRQSYAKHRSWIDMLLHLFGVGHWCIIVDADELLVYPHMSKVKLRMFLNFLESRGWNALHALLVDMYPRGPVDRLNYRSGEDFRRVCQFFDPPPYEAYPFVYPGCGRNFNTRYCGGARKRVFGKSVCISEFPVVRFSRDIFLHYGRHSIENAKIADVQAALLHFKFLPDFPQRARTEAKRGVHWMGAEEFKVYVKTLEEKGTIDLWTEKSIQLKDEGQLLKLGILKSTPEYDFYASRLERAARTNVDNVKVR